jgi:hypothetical protein
MNNLHLRTKRASLIAWELDELCNNLDKRLKALRKDFEGELRPNYRLYIKKSSELLKSFRANYARLKAINKAYTITGIAWGISFYGTSLSEAENYWAYV